MIDKKSAKAKNPIAANIWNLESIRILAIVALYPTMPRHAIISQDSHQWYYYKSQ